jgi:hypothetical protein
MARRAASCSNPAAAQLAALPAAPPLVVGHRRQRQPGNSNASSQKTWQKKGFPLHHGFMA